MYDSCGWVLAGSDDLSVIVIRWPTAVIRLDAQGNFLGVVLHRPSNMWAGPRNGKHGRSTVARCLHEPFDQVVSVPHRGRFQTATLFLGGQLQGTVMVDTHLARQRIANAVGRRPIVVRVDTRVMPDHRHVVRPQDIVIDADDELVVAITNGWPFGSSDLVA